MSRTDAIDDLLIGELTAATCDVFRTMVFRELEGGAAVAGQTARPAAHVVGSVAFAGSISGLIVFESSLEAARLITASMLGVEPAAVNGEMPDAIGEVTNMIAGSFRTRAANLKGERWAMSVPIVTFGSDFQTRYASGVQRMLCRFQMHAAEIFVELIVTRSAP